MNEQTCEKIDRKVNNLKAGERMSEKEIIVGGQAVIEGVMMRGPNSWAVAVRRPDGTIASRAERLPKPAERHPLLRLPVLRGGAILLHSMALGIRALNFSATVAFEEESEGEGTKSGAERGSGGGGGAAAAGSLAFALIFNILLFIVLPLLLTNILFIWCGWASPAGGGGISGEASPGQSALETTIRGTIEWLRIHLRPVRPSVGFNLVDGLIRMAFFITMIWGFSKMQDIRRVFEYHGAEHKTVFTWEAGEELTVANAQRHPRQHPRCGTSFLMVVMLVSIVLFSVVRFDSLWLNLLTRIALVPLIAGISYEVIRAAGRRETSPVFRLMTLPGIWLQNVTTQEPSEDQLEVAIHALRESLKLEPTEA